MATPVRRVVDASSLIALAKVGRLELLRVGVPEIVVPEAVMSEASVRGLADPVLERIRQAAWLRIVPASAIPPIVLAWDLGSGENSVIAIALADPECEALLDDRDARRCAQALGIQARGTLGLVILARQIGALPLARPVVEELRKAGFYLTDELAGQALALVGE